MEGLQKFPQKRRCKHNFTIEIKPLVEKDIEDFALLHSSLPKEELSLLREDLNDPFYKQIISRQIQDELVYRLVAWHKDIMVGSIVFHRGQARWTRHTCEIRSITHKDYRRYGIASILFKEAIPFATEQGIERLYVHLLPEQDAARKMIKNIGFKREATLRDHIKDKYDMYHNVRIYAYDLEGANKAMEEYLSQYTAYSG